MRTRGGLTRLVLAGAMLAVTGAGPAVAQISAEQQNAMKANCRSDFMSKCMGKASPGTKEALVCLQQNVASLSPACQTAVRATMAQPPAAAAPAPAKPAAAAAPAASPPPPAAAETPKPAAAAAPAATAPAAPAPVAAPAPAKPAAKPAPKPAAVATPSAPPAAAPAAPPPVRLRQATVQELLVVRRRCGTDMEIHCRNVPPGDGRIAACLGAHHPALSPGCKAALAPLQN